MNEETGAPPMQAVPRGKIEWNLNTVLGVVTLASIVFGGVALWTNTTRDIEELRDWRKKQEEAGRERNAEVRDLQTKYEERFRFIEKEIGKVENLSYRLTVSEQSVQSGAAAVKRLEETVNKQGTDIRLALEILQRLESRGIATPDRRR